MNQSLIAQIIATATWEIIKNEFSSAETREENKQPQLVDERTVKLYRSETT